MVIRIIANIYSVLSILLNLYIVSFNPNCNIIKEVTFITPII